ncbi:MAG TPA: hypothetical protein VNO24_27305 [Blastocatellia bacterium]|nr:hypothetical protein [Blastocatellia bacterium]
MSDELTKKLPNDVPDTEPTILTLMERLNSMQEVMDRRHIETQELFTTVRADINGVRDDINAVRDDINGVRADMNGFRDEINGVRGDINGVRADMNGFRDDINAVRDDMNGFRDDINQRMQEQHELLVSRIDLLRTETDAHFRKQDHLILALNDNVLHARGDQKELFERIAVLEDKAS